MAESLGERPKDAPAPLNLEAEVDDLWDETSVIVDPRLQLVHSNSEAKLLSMAAERQELRNARLEAMEKKGYDDDDEKEYDLPPDADDDDEEDMWEAEYQTKILQEELERLERQKRMDLERVTRRHE